MRYQTCRIRQLVLLKQHCSIWLFTLNCPWTMRLLWFPACKRLTSLSFVSVFTFRHEAGSYRPSAKLRKGPQSLWKDHLTAVMLRVNAGPDRMVGFVVHWSLTMVHDPDVKRLWKLDNRSDIVYSLCVYFLAYVSQIIKTLNYIPRPWLHYVDDDLLEMTERLSLISLISLSFWLVETNLNTGK